MWSYIHEQESYISVVGSTEYNSIVAISSTMLKKTCCSFLESNVAACCLSDISAIRGCLHFPVGGVGAEGGPEN